MRIVILIVLGICIGLGSCKKNSGKSGTCSDGILNQNETAVDCGGKCSKCATCSDGIHNQGETAVDCGGPCTECEIKYPEYGNSGFNVLFNIDSVMAVISTGSPYHYYSIRAELGNNTTLKLKLTPGVDDYSYLMPNTSMTGWTVLPFTTKIREINAVGPLVCDAAIAFYEHNSLKIEFYKNNATIPFKTKTLTW